MVDITHLDPQPECFWTYDGTVFAAPVPSQLSSEEIEAANQAHALRYWLKPPKP
jgi:hypothetical protein